MSTAPSADKPPNGFEFLADYRMEIDYEQITRESIRRAVSEGTAQDWAKWRSAAI